MNYFDPRAASPLQRQVRFAAEDRLREFKVNSANIGKVSLVRPSRAVDSVDTCEVRAQLQFASPASSVLPTSRLRKVAVALYFVAFPVWFIDWAFCGSRLLKRLQRTEGGPSDT